MQTHPLDRPEDGDEISDNAQITPHYWYHSAGNALLWAMPLINALCDTAVMAMAVRDMEDDDTDSTKIVIYLCAISLFQFMQSMALSGKSTVDSFKETVEMLRTRELPQTIDWPELSIPRERFAIGAAGAATLFSASCDFAAGYYFISKTPDDYAFKNQVNQEAWLIFSATIGGIVAFTTIFTEGTSTYKLIRRKLSNQILESDYPRLQTIAKSIGYPVAIVGAAENIIEAFATCKNLIGPKTNAAQYGLLTACLPRGFTDFSFAGKLSTQGIYLLLEKFAQGVPQKREAIAFLLAAGTAIVVVIPQRALTHELLSDPETSLPFISPALLINTLAWGVMIRDGIVQTLTLYPYAHQLTEAILQKCITAIQKIQNLCGYAMPEDLQRSLLNEHPAQHSIQNSLRLVETPSPIPAYEPPMHDDVENPPALVSTPLVHKAKLHTPTFFRSYSLQPGAIATPVAPAFTSQRSI